MKTLLVGDRLGGVLFDVQQHRDSMSKVYPINQRERLIACIANLVELVEAIDEKELRDSNPRIGKPNEKWISEPNEPWIGEPSERAIAEAQRVLTVALTARGIAIEPVMVHDLAVEIQKGYDETADMIADNAFAEHERMQFWESERLARDAAGAVCKANRWNSTPVSEALFDLADALNDAGKKNSNPRIEERCEEREHDRYGERKTDCTECYPMTAEGAQVVDEIIAKRNRATGNTKNCTCLHPEFIRQQPHKRHCKKCSKEIA